MSIKVLSLLLVPSEDRVGVYSAVIGRNDGLDSGTFSLLNTEINNFFHSGI